MKYLIVPIILISGMVNITFLQAQTINIPSLNDIVSVTDCERHTSDVKNIIEWLISNRFDNDTLTRKQARDFVFNWVRKNEKVQVKPYGNILMPVLKSKSQKFNEEFMTTYLGGMTLYAMEYPDSAYSVSIQRKGIETIIEVWNKNKDLLTDYDKLTLYNSLIEKNELEKWIYKNILHK